MDKKWIQYQVFSGTFAADAAAFYAMTKVSLFFTYCARRLPKQS
jgi:hypothetical protein